ncbi:hypothetical protein AB0I00_30760 [Streptomyces sp. NPDC050803]|uniref:hypothetical protein n=1 Tax=unclassified Streptomyces TaxID=2593676 RepID=UPI00342EB0F3
MAVVMSLRWNGRTPEQYNAVRDRVRWEEQTPEGLVLHAAWFEGDGLHVTDVWETEEQWERFLAERLVPAFKDLGFTDEPDFHFSPLHRRLIGPAASGAAS